MAYVIKNYKNYRYLNKGPLMWKLGDVLMPVLRGINDCKKAVNTPVSIGNRGIYAFLDVRSRGGFITGIKGETAFMWNRGQWMPLGSVAA